MARNATFVSATLASTTSSFALVLSTTATAPAAIYTGAGVARFGGFGGVGMVVVAAVVGWLV